MRAPFILTGLVAIALAACSTGTTPAPSPVASPEPTPAASASPSPAAVASPSGSAAAPLLVKVHFDGKTCTYLGPESLPDGTLMKFQFTTTPEQASNGALVVFGVTKDMPDDFMGKVTSPASDIPAWVLEFPIGQQIGPGEMVYTARINDPAQVATVVACATSPDRAAVAPALRDAIYPASLLSIIPK